MGLKLLAETEDLVVTFSDLGKQGTILYGLDPVSGSVVWEKQYDFRPEEIGPKLTLSMSLFKAPRKIDLF